VINLDEVAVGILVNAISSTGRWLGTAATSAASGRGRFAEDLSIARWFETYRVTSRVPDLPDLSPAATSRLAELLRGDDVQAAVQELLAARLTDAPETDAARAREAFVLTLTSADQEISAYAAALADYYDDEISELVGRLGESPLLTQIRSEALSARMIAVLNAIERHTAVLSTRPRLRTEADFLTRYRAHVLDQHGKLEPPDFERRRRVPIRDIYVPTVIYEEIRPERTVASLPAEPPSLTVWELADGLDRSVLLGDPGGGKTTASTVLMHHFASDAARRVPFLVTLRSFAAEDPPSRSVVGFIEHELETLYQCPSPPGLVDMLLLTGRAVVVFDGLDELLDTARRADVATRVERFCTEYPLAPVLVTSRLVGYDQAQLDERQFTCYRLGGFRDSDVADYARKWFALEEGAGTHDAELFMAESESVPDLRANPLLLSLMCILYRGEGSLPRNRAEVYEQCANLLFRRWDARRRIHQDLRAGHLLEPALRHLAWWLFSRSDAYSAVTERELVAATAEFLTVRGFESADDARDAAREFVEFSRGRMWVFSDAGITASGEKLYAFTHRTFLEYFAAAQLAYDSDTPEKLARTLAPHTARGEWEIVGELAVQIKDTSSREGAKRIYATLLDERRRRSPKGRSNILQFMALCQRSVDPSPQVTRRLASETLDFLFSGDMNNPTYYLPLAWLLACCYTNVALVDESVAAVAAALTSSHDPSTRLTGLRVSTTLASLLGESMDPGPHLPANHRLRKFWERRTEEYLFAARDAIIAAAPDHVDMRCTALWRNLITPEHALTMKGGLLPLFQVVPATIFRVEWAPYLTSQVYLISHGFRDYTGSIPQAVAALETIGRFVARDSQLPYVPGPPFVWSNWDWSTSPAMGDRPSSLKRTAYLGGAVVLLIAAEPDPSSPSQVLAGDPSRLGVFSALYPYLEQRHAAVPDRLLPDLPVPVKFKQTFLDWADRKVDFVGTANDSPSQLVGNRLG